MKINNRKIVIFIISIISIGLIIYLPHNIHFKALCGDSVALVEIGSELIKSENKIDQNKGAELLTRASEIGNVDAIYIVGWCHSYGKGTEQSNLAGYDYFMRAYELKSKMSSEYKRGLLYHLGICYLEGKGTFHDIDKSIDMLIESAKLGSIDALRELAIAYGFLALRIYERKEKEEVIFFPDFYYTNPGFYSQKRDYQDRKEQYNKEMDEKEKQCVSYGIKAYAYALIYSQTQTDFDLKKSLESRKEVIPATNLYSHTSYVYDEGLHLTPARHEIAEIYAKEFQQSIKSD
jgi:hypothetical protein